VLPAPNFDATLAFAKDVLGFELSDIFNFRPDPSKPPMRIHFLHCQTPATTAWRWPSTRCRQVACT
jgi:catechol 2,3-dioxygenase-like lactoylglutathione lyase family enzyme